LIKDGTKLIQIFGLVAKLVIYWKKENEIRSIIGDINVMVMKKTDTAAIRHFKKLDDYIDRCLRFYFGFGIFIFFITAFLKPFGLLLYNRHVQKEWDFSVSFPNL
jgi:hypothetical protein